MKLLPNTLRRVCWLALLAMLGLALAPTVSHALASAGGNSRWAEVCAPGGLRLVDVGGTTETDGGPMPVASHLADCPLCSPSSAGTGMPPAQPSTPVPRQAGEPPAGPDAQVLGALPPWRDAQPRAPPFGA